MSRPAGNNTGADVRAAAAKVITAVRFEGRSLKAVLGQALAHVRDDRDRALCEAISFEALRWMPRYEVWLSQLLDKPLKPNARTVHALLLAGLAQLDAIGMAPYAAISATAQAARLLKQPGLVGLVNAVLRNFVRQRDELINTLPDHPEAVTAHPAWLVERLQADWPQQAHTVLEQNNARAPMWLRVNTQRISRDDYLAELAHAGIEAQAAEASFAPAAIRLTHALRPTKLPGWETGLVSVQDLSAQGAALLLEAEPGERVLDIGAAPGGKTSQILETWDTLDSVIALDVDADRLTRLQSNLTRLGLEAHRIVVGDAATPQQWWDGNLFDRILLDAPCSATGVIRRQPDIKWHRRADDIPTLVALQARLLDAAWPMLRPGGRLVYATCSVLRDENDHQIDAFLARTPSAVPVPLPDALGQRAGAGVQRFPQVDDGDGFFYAALEKCGTDIAPAERLR